MRRKGLLGVITKQLIFSSLVAIMLSWLLDCLGFGERPTESPVQPTTRPSVLVSRRPRPYISAATPPPPPPPPATRSSNFLTSFSRESRPHRAPVAALVSSTLISFPLAVRLKSTSAQQCAHPRCTKRAVVSCSRCLCTGYCGEAHRRASWSSRDHLSHCTPHIATRAAKIGFHVNLMHTTLRPRRGAPDVDPYTSWAFNSAASFQCGRCHHRWSSAKASAAINLRTLQLVKVYEERCIECDKDAVPCFFDLSDSIASVLAWLRDLRDGNGKHRQAYEQEGDPHLAELCERCHYGAFPHSH